MLVLKIDRRTPGKKITKAFRTGAIIIAATAGSQAYATVLSGNVYWSSGINSGDLAATCSVTFPDEQPLAVSRTLVVGNDVPNGTEIFSWGYGAWSSDVVMSCVGSGKGTNSGAISGFSPTNTFTIFNVNDSYGGIIMNNSGLRLKLWVKAGTGSTPCTGVGCDPYSNAYSLYGYATGGSFLSTGEEAPLQGSYWSDLYQKINPPVSPADNLRYYPTMTGRYSMRASLIKVGNVSYGPLKVNNPPPFQVGTTSINTLFQGSGITIAPPACRLKTTDYTIPMGTWEAVTFAGTPVYGTPEPVNLSLECSGKTEHVHFRFEDTGTSLSANKNVTLYDNAGGNKIDGLEIELLYNGNKADVDNTTLTDTGSHGSFVSFEQAFSSASTASFQARYVQNGGITASGRRYSGPVVGKVNMYVTYD
ncbi:fimbrial protein [Metakosakonia massiliensis]